MPTLYIKKTCAFCHKVRTFAVTSGIDLVYKDIYSDPSIVTELMERGGKVQVPYLADEKTGVSMYESDDIVKYLQSTYVH